jgi:hypothetical protein
MSLACENCIKLKRLYQEAMRENRRIKKEIEKFAGEIDRLNASFAEEIAAIKGSAKQSARHEMPEFFKEIFEGGVKL